MDKNNPFKLGRSLTKVVPFHRIPITIEKQKQQLKEKAQYQAKEPWYMMGTNPDTFAFGSLTVSPLRAILSRIKAHNVHS